jgi:protein SCO1/2
MTRFVLFALLMLAVAPVGAVTPGDLGYREQIGAQVPTDAGLRDEHGAHVRLADVAGGRPVVLELVYYHCPNLCGVVLADLLTALHETGSQAGRDYSLVALSIDPNETPADAAASKQQHIAAFPSPGAELGWHFLTGDAAALGAVERAVGFRAHYDAVEKQFWHPAGIVMLTPQGKVSNYLLGVGYRASDLRQSISDARLQRLAEPASPILLLCFHIDPATGRLTLAVTRLVQAAAVISVLGISLLMLRGLRRR